MFGSLSTRRKSKEVTMWMTEHGVSAGFAATTAGDVVLAPADWA
jgi:hypothetical protein